MSNEYWDKVVNTYKKLPKEYPMEYGNWVEPYAEQLAKAYKESEIINKPITDGLINQMEEKLNTKLPPSYLEFLKYSNGLLLSDRFTNLLPLENTDWFYTVNKEWVDIWNEEDDDISDEEYLTYGKEQNTCAIRNKYLKTALQISDSAEGDVLLLNPEVKFGDEWEAWWFGNALAGAIRFKSFKELLEFLLSPAEDENIESISEEEYAQILEKDKERLKNMEDSLLGSIITGMQNTGLDNIDMMKEFEKELALVQNMEKETIDRVNKGLDEKDKIEVEQDNAGFMQKVKDMIGKKS